MGKALKAELEKKDYEVKAFSRSVEQKKDQIPFDFFKDQITGDNDLATMVFTIPLFKDFKAAEKSFKFFLDQVPKAGHFIYISSTSVFKNDQGVCDENTEPAPLTKRALEQRRLELLVEQNVQNYTIVRSAGQIGPDRFPKIDRSKVKWGALDRVNLIDQKDLVTAIFKILSMKSLPKYLHAVSPYHPFKFEYYFGDEVCDKNLESNSKIIKSNFFTEQDFANLKLEHPNRLKF